jgi:hypothetical protein
MDLHRSSAMRDWKILCWNIRGINSTQKRIAIRSKVHETGCDIICLQEIKRENFDATYLRNFAPLDFDCFDFVPSQGASSGTIVIWRSSKFMGCTIFQNNYAMSIELASTLNGMPCILTNVYATRTPDGKMEFLNWFNNIDMSINTDWLLVSDFNLIRRQSDRNKPGGNVNGMLGFNEAISNLRLEELKLYSNRFTLSNNQQSPLLKRLDWFFTSVSWVATYPGSKVTTLSRVIFDHHPCLVSISTNILKAKIFRFKNFWMLHDDFSNVLNHGWSLPTYQTDAAKNLTAKLKNSRQVFLRMPSKPSKFG